MQPLPVLFLADFYNDMPKIVNLMDPLGNIFIISIKERTSRVYLNHGSSRIGEVYNLFCGGWITIKYLHGNTFKMFVRDRMGKQIMYPFPPRKYGLGEPELPMSIIHEENDEFMFIDAVHFHHSLVKNVAVEETTTPFLVCFIDFNHSLFVILFGSFKNIVIIFAVSSCWILPDCIHSCNYLYCVGQFTWKKMEL